MEVLTYYIPATRRNRPGIPIDGPRWVTIHDTGNPSRGADALAHASYLLSPTAENLPASWHFTVDDRRIIQHLPMTEVGWHAGDGRTPGGGNMASIGVEICEHADGDRDGAEDFAARLVAALVTQLGTIEGIRQHYDWSGKDCPRVLRGRPNGWKDFLRAVGRYREAIDLDRPSDWAREAWDWGIDLGITDGRRPRDTATREEIVTMLYRARGSGMSVVWEPETGNRMEQIEAEVEALREELRRL